MCEHVWYMSHYFRGAGRGAQSLLTLPMVDVYWYLARLMSREPNEHLAGMGIPYPKYVRTSICSEDVQEILPISGSP